MKRLNNKRLTKLISVFLLLIGFLYFSIQFTFNGEVDDLLRNEFEYISSIVGKSGMAMYNSDEQTLLALNANYPSFNKKTNNNNFSNSEVDFPTAPNLQTLEASRRKITPINSGSANSKNEVNYSYIEKKLNTDYATGIKNVSNKTSIIQSDNSIHSIGSGVQFDAVSDNKFQSIPNNSNNSFLANNSLSLTTDLSGNNSPMMIDGGSNPGDPGVPVGDGTWVLIVMMLAYCSKGFRPFKSTISS